jgi:hypothetical protein
MTAAFVSIVLMAILQMFSSGFLASVNVENSTVARNLAESRIEQIKNLSFSAVTSEALAPVTGYAGFRRQVVVTQPQTTLKQVTVFVFWREGGSDLNYQTDTQITSL